MLKQKLAMVAVALFGLVTQVFAGVQFSQPMLYSGIGQPLHLQIAVQDSAGGESPRVGIANRGAYQQLLGMDMPLVVYQAEVSVQKKDRLALYTIRGRIPVEEPLFPVLLNYQDTYGVVHYHAFNVSLKLNALDPATLMPQKQPKFRHNTLPYNPSPTARYGDPTPQSPAPQVQTLGAQPGLIPPVPVESQLSVASRSLAEKEITRLANQLRQNTTLDLARAQVGIWLANRDRFNQQNMFGGVQQGAQIRWPEPQDIAQLPLDKSKKMIQQQQRLWAKKPMQAPIISISELERKLKRDGVLVTHDAPYKKSVKSDETVSSQPKSQGHVLPVPPAKPILKVTPAPSQKAPKAKKPKDVEKETVTASKKELAKKVALPDMAPKAIVKPVEMVEQQATKPSVKTVDKKSESAHVAKQEPKRVIEHIKVPAKPDSQKRVRMDEDLPPATKLVSDREAMMKRRIQALEKRLVMMEGENQQIEEASEYLPWILSGLMGLIAGIGGVLLAMRMQDRKDEDEDEGIWEDDLEDDDLDEVEKR
ncbi:type IV pilus assembly protein FimV [Magnetococcus sp. PR-3]|uniref:type IV pilus assembly protein FimV n=1 Tax=Magnetococcus sp. PR-3 TaxID=3120355 RepID=UPI002FCDF34D